MKMGMHREGFSEFLHKRRVALGRRWKRILSDAYLSRATLHRIRNGDPHHPIAEVDSLRSLANALSFASWADMVAAFEADNPRAGLPPGFTPDDNDDDADRANPSVDNGDPVLTLSKALNLSPTELVRRLGMRNALGGVTVPAARDLPTALRPTSNARLAWSRISPAASPPANPSKRSRTSTPNPAVPLIP